MPLILPLRIRAVAEAIVVEDAAGVIAACVYFENEPGRRAQTKRVTLDEAVAIAQTIARALTERMESPGARQGPERKTAPPAGAGGAVDGRNG